MTRTVTNARCILCDYDLAGLSSSGLCPECACPIQDSITPVVLASCKPDYLKRLRTGVVVVELAVAFLIVQSLLAMFYLGTAANIAGLKPTPIYAVILLYLLPVSSVIQTVGWWFLTAIDPCCPATSFAPKSCQLVRMSQIITVVIFIAQAILYAWLKQNEILLAGAVAFVVRYCFEANYIVKLAALIQNAEIKQRAEGLQVAGPVFLTLGSFCVGIGPFIVLAMYLSALELIRKDLKANRQALSSHHE